jgi:hypothetical protein
VNEGNKNGGVGWNFSPETSFDGLVDIVKANFCQVTILRIEYKEYLIQNKNDQLQRV